MPIPAAPAATAVLPEPLAPSPLNALTGLIAASWMLLPPWPKTTRSNTSRSTISQISATPSTRAEMCTSK